MKSVKGYGPVPCDICLIGQRPGKVEVYRGKPFVGPSGEMLADYLLAAGIDKAQCYVTNVVKTFEGDDDVTAAEIERDLPDLKAELLQCRPKYIGLLGKVAVSVLLPSVPDFDMYWGHGLQFMEKMPWGWVRMMPCYHPAAGMHQTSIQGSTAWDFEQFGRMVKGEKVGEYREHRGIANYILDNISNWAGDEIAAIDTEGSVKHPWCLSWSHKAGKAQVQQTSCARQQRGLGFRAPKVTVMHHSLHDLAVLSAMGISVGRFEDTLLKAALLGIEPHGLKDLARRHLGMRMRSYDELVANARRERAINYLGEVVTWLNNR